MEFPILFKEFVIMFILLSGGRTDGAPSMMASMRAGRSWRYSRMRSVLSPPPKFCIARLGTSDTSLRSPELVGGSIWSNCLPYLSLISLRRCAWSAWRCGMLLIILGGLSFSRTPCAPWVLLCMYQGRCKLGIQTGLGRVGSCRDFRLVSRRGGRTAS